MYKFKILHFFCRPCGEYHLKTHPHYQAMKRRAAKRKRERESRDVSSTPLLRVSDITSDLSEDMKDIMRQNSHALDEMELPVEFPVDIGEHPLKADALKERMPRAGRSKRHTPSTSVPHRDHDAS